MKHIGAFSLVALLWLMHWLPLRAQAALGHGLGAMLYGLVARRRQVARRNIELCFPAMSATEHETLAREHFRWLGRSLLERGLLRFASARRLKRLMRIEGDLRLAERLDRPVMWLMPHFAGLDWICAALALNQPRSFVSIYQRQSNPGLDALLLRLRSRFGRGRLVERREGVRTVLGHIRRGDAFLNLPDMDFGPKDSAFVPFFGVPANTLLAPGRIARTMKMIVQPVTVTMLPKGQGVVVHAHEPLPDYPSGDAQADALRFHHWLEARILENPAQYYWVHKRFKTRPAGEPSLY